MAGGIVSPASLLDLISDIVETPLNSGVFKKDCADLTRRVCLLTHLVEEIRDSTPIDSAASSSSENDWWSDLVVGLQDTKRLLSTARLQARDSFDGAAKRISFRFQCVTWKLEKALSNLPYDLYDISDEVIDQVELARSQLRRAMQRYGSLNSEVQIYKSPWVSKKLQCIVIVLTLKAKISAGYDPTLHFGSKALKKNNQASCGAKKLVKDPKSRLSKDAADKRKASRPIRKGRPTKMSPLDEARARADKLRNFKADLQKMKKEKEFPSMFGFSVSHTTRAPRCMEKNSVHYHFTDKTVMEKEIKDGKFLEFASVHGNLYGTSIESVEVVTDSGKRCILDIDVQGARSVKASSLDAIFIFVCPPSMNELEDRLRARGTETEEQIQKRLRNAEAEIKAGKSSGIFGHILYNDNLEECYKNLKNLLGINDHAPVNGVEVEGINLPKEYTVTKMEDKILIQETGEGTKNKMIVLDLSSINGGAPGRTRGIVLETVKSS